MRLVPAVFCLVAGAAAASADTVVLKSGKKLEGVVCEVKDGKETDPVVVNPYNSRCSEMTYGITDKEKIPAEKVASVTIEDAPLVHWREEASLLKLRVAPDGSDSGDSAKHMDLAKFCETHKLVEERDRELKLALCADPTNADALAAFGRSNWDAWKKGNPLADDALRTLESEYVKLEKPAELQSEWDQMAAKGSTRTRAFLERARRSAKFPLGRRDKVPLTVRSELSPGATYCIYLPKSYDPLQPTGLVVGLHGGGQGAKDIVTGSGEEAMNFYMDVAEERGVVVVCPSALQAPWSGQKNVPMIDAVVEEMRILYDVDENRIWLTGHSMGGFGSWSWGPMRADVWAAFAPCAGGGGSPDTKGLPVYIYHGADDNVVGVDGDRAVANNLAGDKKKPDFVYTEFNGVGHGFPDPVRHEIFRFFTGRWKDEGKKRAVWPRSSFDRKPSKDEIKCFGDPSAAPTAGGAAGADAKISDLCAALEKGGGRGVEAAKELAAHKDAATVACVAHLLHSKKSSSDTKVLAATTIGDIGLADGVKPLAAEIVTDDFRVLDAVTTALGKIGGKEAVEPLGRAGKAIGAFFDGGDHGGRYDDFTEYETRCQSFGRLCDALAAVGDAASALPVIEKEIVARVFAPKAAYTVPVDSRFTEIPPRARRDLMERMAKCLAALKDPRGKALLETSKAPWKAEAELVKLADEGVAAIGG